MLVYYRSMRIKDEKKYKAILNAAITQFKDEGFAKASISKIAKLADLSPATIYIYFENKEDMIVKLYLYLRKEMSEIVLGDISLSGCIEAAYKKIWKNYYYYCLNNEKAFDYMMQFINSPFAVAVKSDSDLIYFSKIYELFSLGKDKGVIKQVSDEILFAYSFYPAAQLANRNLCCGTKLCEIGVDNACLIAWDAVKNCGDGVECKQMNLDLQERLTNIFRKGEKESQKIGVEFEHFLIDKETLRSYQYFEKDGQLEIAYKLKKNGWAIDYEENGNILNMSKDGNAISFEPGGQFEISTKPFLDIADIDLEYQKVFEEVSGLLMDKQALVSLGYHPKTKIDDLELLPKERYKLMYNYLHSQGNMARNMMKGTASTQVSIDFESEEDFIKKYRVANFLSPFIARLFDASPIFEGDLYPDKNLRINIWENTDPSRCKLPPGSLDERFDYRHYAKYIMNTKPILMPTDQGIKFTKDRTLSMLSKSNFLSDEELEHAITMVFPDVRLKNYIEIRVADALPYPYNMALPALIKAIFYNKSNLDYYYALSLGIKDQDIITINHHMKKSYDFNFMCMHESINCKTFIDELFSKALDVLGDDKKYLETYIEWLSKHNSFTDYLSSLYGSQEFIDQLTGV